MPERYLTILRTLLLMVSLQAGSSPAQEQEVRPQIINKPVVEGKVTVLNLGPHFTTTIRMSEPVSSVVVGDPTIFEVEHSDKEPKLVFVKPLTAERAESNLFISTISGHSLSLLIRSGSDDSTQAPNSPRHIHFLMNYHMNSGFLIEDTGQPSVLIPETQSLSAISPSDVPVMEPSINPALNPMELLLKEQRRAVLPPLEGSHIRAGISRVYRDGIQMFVLYSVVNQSKGSIELLPPQVQLAGSPKKNRQPSSSEQLPVSGFRFSPGRLGPGERADGVAQFEKPAFKLSHESYLLQIAESAAVDRPVLVPIRLSMAILLKGESK